MIAGSGSVIADVIPLLEMDTMKAPTVCPSCEASFNVSRDKEGKRAKCPKCQQPFKISFAVGSPSPSFPQAAKPPALEPKLKDTPKARAANRTFSMPLWLMITIPTLLALVTGYFVGREHLRYQMQSALQQAFGGLANAMPSSTPTQSSRTSSLTTQTPVEPEESLPQLEIGAAHQADGFSITLLSAKIATAEVKQAMGGVGTGKKPDLIFTFSFTNTDDRKIKRFDDGNQFTGGHFRLRDDVDNVIRGINYGIMATPVGALTGSEDISPGDQVTHVELFSVPPPKTKFLILTVDLGCLGGEGEIEFKVPASAIAK